MPPPPPLQRDRETELGLGLSGDGQASFCASLTCKTPRSPHPQQMSHSTGRGRLEGPGGWHTGEAWAAQPMQVTWSRGKEAVVNSRLPGTVPRCPCLWNWFLVEALVSEDATVE